MRISDDGDFAPFGSRSGLLESGSAPLVTDGGGTPSSTATVATVAPRSASDAQQNGAVAIADSYAYEGTRTDIAGGRGVRCRVGLQTDGKFGLRVWDANGVLRVDQTW